MKILTMREFKKDYKFDLMNELLTLKKIKKETFNQKLRNRIEKSLGRLLYKHRPKSDKDLIIKLDYILYLKNFLLDDVQNIDRLYQLVHSKSINIDDLKHINNNLRKLII